MSGTSLVSASAISLLALTLAHQYLNIFLRVIVNPAFNKKNYF
jgi:hypothetical protein